LCQAELTFGDRIIRDEPDPVNEEMFITFGSLVAPEKVKDLK
jgi:hypothetical protein